MVNQSRDNLLRPEAFLGEMLKKYARDGISETSDAPQFLMRASVVAVDVEGGKLENPSGEGSVSHDFDGKKREFKATVGPKNPPNSVKARIVQDGQDQFMSDDDLGIFWPLFQGHVSMPIKPGEHVYVMFEDRMKKHGLWVSRVAGQEGSNVARGRDNISSRKQEDDSLSAKFPDVPSDPAIVDDDPDAGESSVTPNLEKLWDTT